jgi:hypothetical protein
MVIGHARGRRGADVRVHGGATLGAPRMFGAARAVALGAGLVACLALGAACAARTAPGGEATSPKAPAAKAGSARAAGLRCAPLTDDPAWLYAAGEAQAATKAEAERVARERALGELARSYCASITTTSRTTEREANGAYEVSAEDTIEVRARLDGLAGVEERERGSAPVDDGVAACVILRLSRLELDARRKDDATQVANAVRVAREAGARCDASGARAIDEARARLVGVCPGTRAEGVAVPGARALLDDAARRGAANRAAVARKWAVGVTCADKGGAARPCPAGLSSAVEARLGALGEAPSGTRLSEADAARVARGQGADVVGGLCESQVAVFSAEQTGKSERALKGGGAEHFAVVAGRWSLVSNGGAPRGEEATANAGGYAADEAMLEAAKKALGAAAWPRP